MRLNGTEGKCPVLLLYSKDDELIHWKHVKSFGDKLRDASIEVSEARSWGLGPGSEAEAGWVRDRDNRTRIQTPIQVREREFVNSAHVGHLRFHRTEYMRECREFIAAT